MSEENRGAMDPAELWRQWYESGAKMWSELLQGNGESVADPYGLYGQWLEGMEELQKRISEGSGEGSGEAGYADPQEMWRRWFASTAESWQRSARLGGEMLSMTPRWMEAMEQAQGNLMSQESPPQDPVQFAAQWYNAVSGPLSELAQEAVEREEFLEPSTRLMQSYASLYKIFRQNSEEYLSSLQLPTRSDVSRVAGLVVSLEEKVDSIEERLEDAEDSQAEAAESAAGLQKRLERVESNVGRVSDGVGKVEGDLGRLTGKLDEALDVRQDVNGLTERLDRVEGKLDQLIQAVESVSANGVPGSEGAESSGDVEATDAARRESETLGVDLSEVEGTGSGGRITVGDVRQKGES